MSGPFDGLTERVFDDKQVLEEDYQPEKILEREGEIEEYRNALKDVLFGRSPPNVFIYGKSGVGKTAVTGYILDSLQEAVADRQEADELHTYKMNCNSRTTFSVTRNLVNSIRGPDRDEFPKRGLGASDAFEALYDIMDEVGGTFLFVLDEVDHLNDADKLLYELPRARANGHIENSRVGIIGISNNYTFRNTLSPKVKGTLMEKEISFSTYTANELQSILSARAEKAFKEGAYDNASISYSSAIAARDTGSARQAIDLLREAGDIAENTGADSITEDHINKARDVVRRGRIMNRIREQPTHGQLLIETVAHLEKDRQTPVKSKTISNQYKSVANKRGVEPLSTLKSVQDHLNTLTMLGFFSRNEHNDGLSGGSYYTYELGLDANDVIEIRDKLEEE